MTVTTAKWTLDDYHKMIAVGLLDGRRVELLNGEIIEMPPEGPERAQQSTDTADYLRDLSGNHAIVRDSKPITLPDSHSEPEPDLAIVEPRRALYHTRHHSKLFNDVPKQPVLPSLQQDYRDGVTRLPLD